MREPPAADVPERGAPAREGLEGRLWRLAGRSDSGGIGRTSLRPENDERPHEGGVRAMNSAATYSPRGSTPKYHRPWQS